MLDVRHLVKRYLGVTAVNDVSFLAPLVRSSGIWARPDPEYHPPCGC